MEPHEKAQPEEKEVEEGENIEGVEGSGLSAAEKKKLKKQRQKAKKEEEKKAAAAAASAASSSIQGGTPVEAATPAQTGSAAEEGEEDDGEGGAEGVAEGGAEGEKKKKKKKKSKKSKTASADAPPSIPLSGQFPTHQYPQGKICEYIGDWGTYANTAEARERDRLLEGTISDLRKAAEAHRQVRRWAREHCRPGVKLFDLVETIENAARTLLETQGLDHSEAGIAFPTGVSLNHCAAHFTPNPGDENLVLTEDDVIKIDIGTHVHGHVIDSAFSMCFKPEFEPLVEASREGTAAGVRTAGIDVLLREVGEAVDEVISSYEVTIGGKTYKCPGKPVRNLFGHSLGNYIVHAGKSVPNAKGAGDSTTRMEEGEMYAIETFASTGKGHVSDEGECSHYMMAPNPDFSRVRNPKARQLLAHIQSKFDTLAFCHRWLNAQGETRHYVALKNLVDLGLVNPYPPLCDQRGCYVSQHEHTLLLRPTCKEVLSYGGDY